MLSRGQLKKIYHPPLKKIYHPSPLDTCRFVLYRQDTPAGVIPHTPLPSVFLYLIFSITYPQKNIRWGVDIRPTVEYLYCTCYKKQEDLFT